MRLATLRTGDTTAAVRVDESQAIAIEGFADVGALLAAPGWEKIAEAAGGEVYALAELEPAAWAPVVPRPGKIICVGLNFKSHILEMGRELPEFPTLFTKYPEALVGPYDPIVVPSNAPDTLDWEGELAVVIGSVARGLEPAQASRAIAGYTVVNDVTVREYQYRTSQWLQGKTFESTSPVGPWLVTGPTISPGAELVTDVDGEVVQHASLDDLVFGPAELVAYVSQILTLRPGDVIATGTPGGVGHARKPPRYLRPGNVVTTAIDTIGTLRNVVV